MRIGSGLLVVAALTLCGQTQAQSWDGDAIRQSLTGQPGDASRGRAIVANRQAGFCLLCHSGPFPEEKFQGNLAPELSVSVSRLSEAQIRARLVDATRMNPDTIMPAYGRTNHLQRVAQPYAGKTVLAPQDIEDVTAFLLTLKTP